MPIRVPLGGVLGSAHNPGLRAAPPAKDAAAGWMTETSPTTSRRGKTNMSHEFINAMVLSNAIYYHVNGRSRRHTFLGLGSPFC
jgi:hypothetical protein